MKEQAALVLIENNLCLVSFLICTFPDKSSQCFPLTGMSSFARGLQNAARGPACSRTTGESTDLKAPPTHKHGQCVPANCENISAIDLGRCREGEKKGNKKAG